MIIRSDLLFIFVCNFSKIHFLNANELQKKLLEWYKENCRPFPWRKTSNPIIFGCRRSSFSKQELHKDSPITSLLFQIFQLSSNWLLLKKIIMRLGRAGYYSRARNFTQLLKLSHVTTMDTPDDFNQIKSLKGIGDYTASAIVSICFGQEQAVVDGNVYRYYQGFLVWINLLIFRST